MDGVFPVRRGRARLALGVVAGEAKLDRAGAEQPAQQVLAAPAGVLAGLPVLVGAFAGAWLAGAVAGADTSQRPDDGVHAPPPGQAVSAQRRLAAARNAPRGDRAQ